MPLGFSETLSFLPIAHPDRAALLAIHTRHLEALRQRQLPSGMYPQVLDVPGSYEEFTITCMLGYAMAHGLRRGWLDTSYRPAMERAWQGVAERIDDTGGLIDCCTNTGVQSSRQAYLDRPAIFGRDDRVVPWPWFRPGAGATAARTPAIEEATMAERRCVAHGPLGLVSAPGLQARRARRYPGLRRGTG